MRLLGKFALVTGGSDGIGLAMCEAFAREGAELCIVGRNEQKLASVGRQLGSADKTLLVPADLSTDSGIATVVEQVKKAGRSLDVLVNNAAVAHLGAFESVS